MCNKCGVELVDNRCPICNNYNKKSGLNYRIVIVIFFLFFIIASSLVIYTFMNKKEETIIENNKIDDEPLVLDKEYYFDNYQITLADGYRIHSQRIIKKDNIYVLFYETENLPVKEINLLKEELIKSFKDSGVEIKNLSLKKLNDTEFIYSEAVQQNTEVLLLYFNSDSNNSVAVVAYDIVTKKQPENEIIYDLTEMFKTIKRKEF